MNKYRYHVELYNTLWGSNPGTQEQQLSPLLHKCNILNTLQICELADYMYMLLWSILLQCKWMRLNQDDRIRLCSQKFATFASRSDFHNANRYDYVAKTPRDVELRNDIVWKLVVWRPRLAFSDTLDDFFLREKISQRTSSSQRTSRVLRELRESLQSLQKFYATVNTSWDRKLFLRANLL